ncbi:PDZ domain-containing protein [Laceyella sacchari]|uniref:PDZ domain-containing protein n=1 Tax=Laceyella sacchari TaxID=37482 RepID=UPI0010D52786|nr:PDZ domain-containing protein [Laceyella sacchari]TCW39130.1 PDZ domain-containing protein [Laceyella sacchari]
MDAVWSSVWQWTSAWGQLVIHPGSWLALIFLVKHTAGLARYERKRFATRLTPPFPLALRAWVMGLLLGAGFSLCSLWGQWVIRPTDLAWIWACTALLAIMRARWACIAYSAGLVALLQCGVTFAPVAELPVTWQPYVRSLLEVRVLDWLWIVCLAHLAEWLLIRLDGSQGARPVLVKGKPALQFHRIWPFPLVLGLAPVPLLLGFGCLNYDKPLEREKRLASTMTLGYTLILAGLITLAEVWPMGVWAAAAFSIAGHEGIAICNRLRVKRLRPYYVSDGNGIKVIAVMPGSPAQQMGIKPGDVVHRVNGKSVPTMAALLQVTEKAAFCKLEVLDEQDDRHIMQKALYEDDPRHLGIIGSSSAGLSIPQTTAVRSGTTASQ